MNPLNTFIFTFPLKLTLVNNGIFYLAKSKEFNADYQKTLILWM